MDAKIKIQKLKQKLALTKQDLVEYENLLHESSDIILKARTKLSYLHSSFRPKLTSLHVKIDQTINRPKEADAILLLDSDDEQAVSEASDDSQDWWSLDSQPIHVVDPDEKFKQFAEQTKNSIDDAVSLNKSLGSFSINSQRKRPIIIDGCNVAIAYSQSNNYPIFSHLLDAEKSQLKFDCLGLKKCVNFFKNEFGYADEDITIILPWNRRPNAGAIQKYGTVNAEILMDLIEKKMCYFCPNKINYSMGFNEVYKKLSVEKENDSGWPVLKSSKCPSGQNCPYWKKNLTPSGPCSPEKRAPRRHQSVPVSCFSSSTSFSKILKSAPPPAPPKDDYKPIYDDEFIIAYAMRVDGLIISRDHFKDIENYCQDLKMRKIIRYNTIKFSFIRNEFVPEYCPQTKFTLKNLIEWKDGEGN